jgi:hypothetical protein
MKTDEPPRARLGRQWLPGGGTTGRRGHVEKDESWHLYVFAFAEMMHI